jgi:hypothetical protein
MPPGAGLARQGDDTDGTRTLAACPSPPRARGGTTHRHTQRAGGGATRPCHALAPAHGDTTPATGVRVSARVSLLLAPARPRPGPRTTTTAHHAYGEVRGTPQRARDPGAARGSHARRLRPRLRPGVARVGVAARPRGRRSAGPEAVGPGLRVLCATPGTKAAQQPPNARGEPPPPPTDAHTGTRCPWGRSAPVRCSGEAGALSRLPRPTPQGARRSPHAADARHGCRASRATSPHPR